MRRCLLVYIIALQLQGCVLPWFTKWDEEALLHDGRTMLVHRFAWTGADAADATEMTLDRDIRSQTLTFTPPGSRQEITWKGEAFVSPQVIEVIGDRVFVVAQFSRGSAEFEKRGCPRFPYIAFVHENGRWREIAMTELPPQVSKANILLDASRWWHIKRYNPPHLLEIREIARINASEAPPDGGGQGYLQFDIPRTIDEWRYKYKAERRWGCSRYSPM
jgi:hypothetical protein